MSREPGTGKKEQALLRRLARIWVALLTLAVLAAPGLAAPAMAHPLGNFTVNRYVRLELSGHELRLYYILDMAEVPAFQENAALDRNHDGTVGDEEATAYAGAKSAEILGSLRLTLNGAPAGLTARDHRVSVTEGQGGLPLLRLEALFTAPLPAGTVDAAFRDDNEPARLGWREIVVWAGDGVTLRSSTAPDTDLSNELRRYPDDLLSSPLDRREARWSAEVAAVSPTQGRPQALGEQTVIPSVLRPLAPVDGAAALLSGRDFSLGATLAALLIAAVLGAFHALSPGHGKTIVAAYLVGSRGTVRHALFLGLTVTATHTLGVYALGLITLFASAYLLPEQVYPWLSLLSGLLVVAVGGALLLRRLRTIWSERGTLPAEAHHHVDLHGDEGHGAHEHTARHDHEHHHPHDHDGDHGHSHTLPGADGAPVTWRALLALGISGGLLPCPSALVLMLSAIALHRVALGLALIVAFSAGLAAVLVGIGLLLVLAGQILTRAHGRMALPPALVAGMRVAPALGALAVVLAGLAITVQSLGQL